MSDDISLEVALKQGLTEVRQLKTLLTIKTQAGRSS